MSDSDEFVDYYAVLDVHPGSDRAAIERAYRILAQLYHPDHSDTADVGRFQEATQAYKVLKDHRRRAEYDELRAAELGEAAPQSVPRDDIVIDGATAAQDAEVHERMLLALYQRRRENTREPAIMPYYLQRDLGCSDESFEFHTWYLKSKGLIEVTEQSELVISIDGVDHVITSSRAAKEKLLLEQKEKSDP